MKMHRNTLLTIFAATTLITGAASFVKVYKNSSKKSLPSKQPYLTIVGPIEMADGIARQTAELAEVLSKDFDLNIISGHIIKTDLSPTMLSILKNSNKTLGKVVLFEESLWAPGHSISTTLDTVTQKNQIRIAYSMLESTRIPQEWVMKLNLYFDAVAVPDSFLIEAYQKSGVKIPIFELPLGLDLTSYLSKPLKKKRNPIMTFGNFSSALDRKNQVLLVQAFAKVFKGREDVALQINCRNGDKATKKAIIDEIIKQDSSNIYFTEFKLKKDAYLKLFEGIDCYVSPSKGEGFSIQPREAMALGIPVIATNNTAQTTICETNLVRSVPSTILEPSKYFGMALTSGFRFNCDVNEIAKALEDVYQNYEKYLENGEEARKWVANYDYSNEHLKNLYKSLVAPKKIILGDKDILHEDFIMTTSPELYEKYKEISPRL